jgi:hypothetical protein
LQARCVSGDSSVVKVGGGKNVRSRILDCVSVVDGAFTHDGIRLAAVHFKRIDDDDERHREVRRLQARCAYGPLPDDDELQRVEGWDAAGDDDDACGGDVPTATTVDG